MANGKRSFFERLTGAISVEQEDERDNDGAVPFEAHGEIEEIGELAVDVYQTPEHIIIKAMVAGVKPEDLEISITREMVTIRGKRVEEKSGNHDYFAKELYWGEFSRTILLPSEVETDESEATERYGLLTLRLPKIDKEKKTKVKVRSY